MKNSMLRNKAFIIGFFAVIASLFLFGVISAGEPRPILSAIPAQSDWVANGITEYKITVSADTVPMDGQGTRAIQFGYFVPQAQGYTFNLVRSELRPSNNFFAGYNTFDFIDSSVVSRVMLTGGSGPVNRTGDVVEMWFTVSAEPGALPNTQTSFQFDSDPSLTYFVRPSAQGGEIIPDLVSVPFTVRPVPQPHVIPLNHSRTFFAKAVQCQPEDC